MPGNVIESGSLKTIRSSVRGVRGAPDGLLHQMVAGNNAPNSETGSVAAGGQNGPLQYLPDSDLGKAWTWNTFGIGDDLSIIRNSTTDGNAEWAALNVGALGTITLLGTQAGYEGRVLNTPSATSGRANSLIHSLGGLSVANKVSWCFVECYLTDPNVANGAWDIYFGWFNKQADPAGTAPTDGCFWSGINSAGTVAFKGNTTGNSTPTASATQFSQAAGTAQSIQLGVVIHGQASADFWWRLPGTGTNTWNKLNQTTNMPRNTIVLRPHLVMYARGTGGSAAMHIDKCMGGQMRANTR